MRIRTKTLVLLLAVTITPMILLESIHWISVRITIRDTQKTLTNAIDKQALAFLNHSSALSMDAANYRRKFVLSTIYEDKYALEFELGYELVSSDAQGKPFDWKKAVGIITERLKLVRDKAGLDTITQYFVTTTGELIAVPGSLNPEAEKERILKSKIYDAAKSSGTLAVEIGHKHLNKTVALFSLGIPVNFPDGSLAGVLLFEVPASHLMAEDTSLRALNMSAQRIMVRPIKSAPPEKSLLILVAQYDSDNDGDFDLYTPDKAEYLHSDNKAKFNLMLKDIRNGRSGSRIMDYHGVKSIWVYGRTNEHNALSLFIIPYESLSAIADSVTQTIDSGQLKTLEIASGIAILIILVAIGISIKTAHSLSEPVTSLIIAGNSLASGNYSARVHIKTGDELQQLGDVFNSMGPKLQEREHIKRSLELASQIQRLLLPKETPKLPRLDVYGNCIYCDETGGDFFDYVETSDGNERVLNIGLGDVTGHGITAALLMATARGMYRSMVSYYRDDLSGLLSNFNTELSSCTDDDKFMTFFCCSLHPESGKMLWASAGHEAALLYRASTGEIETLESTDMLLGVMPEIRYKTGEPVNMNAGDTLIITTDGISEAEGPGEELFGSERLFEAFRKSANKSAEGIFESITKEVEAFRAGTPATDDITMVVVKLI